MRIAGIIYPALNAYDGIAYEIYVSGCYRNCKGCHSPELQSFDYGEPLDTEQLIKDIKKLGNWVDIISFLGGDLLQQDKNEVLRLLAVIKANFPNKKLWLFTGQKQEDLPLVVKKFFDVIKCGEYDETKKQEGFPASSNQKILYKHIDY